MAASFGASTTAVTGALTASVLTASVGVRLELPCPRGREAGTALCVPP
ncbi:hypothetical protein FHU34_12344 [Micromonospora taraxaci]|uniref:Uncharacterized protein n=1 Tax=Micromonospora taraxaci TaxID=1316803 RepID=A0A561VE57_9ACTN|nr:hypothetical protein FHU34_12344 [Micromonospora taraxaci]